MPTITRGENGQYSSGGPGMQISWIYRNPDQINALSTYAQAHHWKSMNILDIGVGHGEEAITYALEADRYGMLNNTSLTFVDILGQALVNPQFTVPSSDITRVPTALASQFVTTKKGNITMKQVPPQIQQKVTQSLNQVTNKWETPIESFVKSDTGHYTVVSANSILYYLGRGQTKAYLNPTVPNSLDVYPSENGDYTAFQSVLLSLAERVEVGGLLLAKNDLYNPDENKIQSDLIYTYLTKNTNFLDVFEVVNKSEGVYARKNNTPLQFITAPHSGQSAQPANQSELTQQQDEMKAEIEKARDGICGGKPGVFRLIPIVYAAGDGTNVVSGMACSLATAVVNQLEAHPWMLQSPNTVFWNAVTGVKVGLVGGGKSLSDVPPTPIAVSTPVPKGGECFYYAHNCEPGTYCAPSRGGVEGECATPTCTCSGISNERLQKIPPGDGTFDQQSQTCSVCTIKWSNTDGKASCSLEPLTDPQGYKILDAASGTCMAKQRQSYICHEDADCISGSCEMEPGNTLKTCGAVCPKQANPAECSGVRNAVCYFSQADGCISASKAHLNDALLVNCFTSGNMQSSGTCAGIARALGVSISDSNFIACVNEYTKGNYDSQLCFDLFKPFMSSDAQKNIQKIIDISEKYGYHITGDDINVANLTMLSSLDTTLGLLPPVVLGYNLQTFQFVHFFGEWDGATNRLGSIWLSDDSVCPENMGGSWVKTDKSLTCKTTGDYSAYMVQTDVHEIMHNQDDRRIKSPYCSNPNESCYTMEAFVNAAASEEKPLHFLSDGSFNETYKDNASLFTNSPPRTETEFFAEYGSLYVTNPDVLRTQDKHIYDVFKTVFGGTQYKIGLNADTTVGIQAYK